MLTDSAQTAVAAAATVNVFLGRPIEFLGVASVVTLLGVYDGQGVALVAGAGNVVTAQWLINVGGVQVVPLAAGSTVNATGAVAGTAPAVVLIAGAGPKADEDTLVANQPVPAGARSQLNIANTFAAAINFRYRAFITP